MTGVDLFINQIQDEKSVRKGIFKRFYKVNSSLIIVAARRDYTMPTPRQDLTSDLHTPLE